MPGHTEDNYIDWTLRGIDRYYREHGYEVSTYSIGQVREHVIPFDRIVHVGDKLVGLQFKAPANDRPPWKYEFDNEQHQKLLDNSWIYYSLPKFTDARLQNSALDHIDFAGARSIDLVRKRPDQSIDWKEFQRRFRSCSIGIRLDSQRSVHDLITRMKTAPVSAYILLDHLHRRTRIIY
jgi:hypothetical protein